jgi:hypothetical protein
MFGIDGINGESIMVDGNWVEKLRSGSSRGRNPADQYSGTDIKEISRRTKLFGGQKEQLLQVLVNVGTYVDALIAELEQARDPALS